MNVWVEVEEALENIISEYEKVNHIISLFQDEHMRSTGLEIMGLQKGILLELGVGPGNFTSMLLSSVESQIIGLDYSDKMLSVARTRVKKAVPRQP